MNPIEKRVKNLKKSYKQKYTFRDEQFFEGYKSAINDVLKEIKSATPELVVIGGNYYVLCYEYGNTGRYYKRMRLFRIEKSSTKTIYYFTNSENKKDKIDVAVASHRVHERVFFTEEQAKNACL